MVALPPAALLIFARHPEPGRVKTRLMPALGATGAAAVYRQMASHVVQQARTLAQQRPLAITVWFTGGSAGQMAAWLGDDLTYRPQPAGDLGQRLATATAETFAQGHSAVVTIGSDCPALDSARLGASLQALATHDVVLGPATDGGYYLIGLRQSAPALFANIAWSTAAVCAQTQAAARQLGLDVALLPPLADVDRPEDLDSWYRIKAAQ